MLKKFFTVLLVVVQLFAAAGCSSPASATPAPTQEGDVPAETSEPVRTADPQPTDVIEERMPELDAMLIPPAEADIEIVKAEHWLQITDDSDLVEGPAFDRDGNLYFLNAGKGQVLKITPPNKDIKVVFTDNGDHHFVSIDIHKDGRLFLCDLNGGIYAMNPDGTDLTLIAEVAKADDLVFDKNGNMYVSQLVGHYKDPSSRVTRISADLQQIDVVLSGYNMCNGIAFSEDDFYLYTTDYGANQLIRSQFQEDGITPVMYRGGELIYQFTGTMGPDSTTVDKVGNVYQPIYRQGRVMIFNPDGMPIKNVLLENRAEYMNCTSMTIKPGTTEGYIFSSGTGGGAIFTFTAPGEAVTMYSHR